MNKIILIGRLGKDPEVKNVNTKKGPNTVANFSLATTRKDKTTNWHNIVVWGKAAEICGKYLSRGSQVAIEGESLTRSWDNDQGEKRYTTEVITYNVEMLGKPEAKKEHVGFEDFAAPKEKDAIPF